MNGIIEMLMEAFELSEEEALKVAEEFEVEVA